jgi:hypothetical protein
VYVWGRGNSWQAGGRSAVAGGWGGRQYTGRENLEQFRTTESQAWASVNNSYSLSNSIAGWSFGLVQDSGCIILANTVQMNKKV